MTLDELETLRDRLNTVLEYERAGERPENLTEEERVRYDMAISLGGHGNAA